MRIFVATAGDQSYHRAQRDEFLELVAADSVGRHHAVAEPGQADAVLFVDLHQHPDDRFLRALREHRLTRTCPERVFVYDERDYPFFTFPGVYVSATRSMGSRFGGAVCGGPYPRLPNRVTASSDPPKFLFSFQGARTHPVRDHILQLRHSRAVLEDASSLDAVSGAGREVEAARLRYRDVVAASKFVLCPRGHGPSSFRLYETLHAGRVPVVISDSWVPPPRIDWSTCAVRVREGDVDQIPRLLEGLEPAWGAMVEAGARVVRAHFERDRLWDHYASSIEALASARRRAPALWWAQPEVARIAGRRLRSLQRIRSRPGADPS